MNKEIENLNALAKWAQDYILEIQKQGYMFDPFALLAGEETKNQKLFTECCSFLHDISERAEMFRETRNRLSFGN